MSVRITASAAVPRLPAVKAKGHWNPLVTLTADLKKGAKPFYLLHGENQWFLSEAVGLLRANVVSEGSEAR